MQLAGQTILVLEDDFLQADEIVRVISLSGAQVVGPCPSIDGCMMHLSSMYISAAVVDINIGAGPSFEIPRELARRSIPFIFLTGYDRTVVPQEFFAVKSLEKPADEDQLVSALVSILSIAV
ncbi:hypothetical protein LPJGGPFB_05127 [Ensifer adhaerens]|uniref:hypothetical protein n=1 Tax=Ensifer adhaerens TaxID=106592 RepID=UPI00156911C0|nr:hypothetical protein [Ensifer adhaerens]NRP21868.1 hypothetical protein [Ensifer adhaerens]